MKLILLGANVALFVLIGVYLADIFAIKTLGLEVIAFLFFAAISALVLVNEIVEKQEVNNTSVFLFPGLGALAAPFLVGKFGLAILIGVLMTIPGLVILIRKLIK